MTFLSIIEAYIKANIIINPTFKEFIVDIKLLISVIKFSMIETLLLERVLYIYYLVQFKKDQVKIQAFLNSSNKVNAIILESTAKLCLKVRFTNIEAQKIDGSIFKIFEMFLACF